jgi:hypothetical protein
MGTQFTYPTATNTKRRHLHQTRAGADHSMIIQWIFHLRYKAGVCRPSGVVFLE